MKRAKKPNSTVVDTIIDARAKEYGSFVQNARLAQELKRAMAEHAAALGKTYTDDQWEALEMIASKISRLMTGNSDHEDSWRDIAGYATLIADRLAGNIR